MFEELILCCIFRFAKWVENWNYVIQINSRNWASPLKNETLIKKCHCYSCMKEKPSYLQILKTTSMFHMYAVNIVNEILMQVL